MMARSFQCELVWNGANGFGLGPPFIDHLTGLDKRLRQTDRQAD